MLHRLGRAPGAERPVVAFIDLGTLLSFDQLASVARRRGVEVLHVTRAGNPLATLASRVVYDRHATWHSSEDLAAALRQAGPARIVDLQCPEFLLGEVIEVAQRLPLPDQVVQALRERLAWHDKRQATRRLQDAGVPVPETVDLPDDDPAPALGRLGLPLVVKASIGSGGEGVRICDDQAQVCQAVADLQHGGARLYAERFLAGETLCWAGVVRDGQVVDACTYRTLQDTRAEGPSSCLRLVDDPEVAHIGAQVAALVRGSGLVNLDLVRDADGRPYVVDVNLRAWHSVVALTASGHDFVAAYLETLHLPGLPRRVPRPTRKVNVFPDQSLSGLERSRRHATARFVRDLWRQRSVLPARYTALQCLLFLRRMAGPREPGGMPSA